MSGEELPVWEGTGQFRGHTADTERARRLAAHIRRRDFILLAGAALAGVAPACAVLRGEEKNRMYGLIGKITAESGQRDALIAILLESGGDMPGCLSYVVAKDPVDAQTVWITEVWDNQESHKASLSLPSVKQAIARGRPLIAQFGQSIVTEPVGGRGLASR